MRGDALLSHGGAGCGVGFGADTQHQKSIEWVGRVGAVGRAAAAARRPRVLMRESATLTTST